MKRSVGFVALLTLVVLLGPRGTDARVPGCIPGRAGCLPTPEQCATGRYNGLHLGPRPTAFASCAGFQGRVVHYVGGDPTIPCGAVIEADQVLIGDWSDPNVCMNPSAGPGFGVLGSRYRAAVSSARGVIATESAVAGAVGRGILQAGGNAVDAAVAAIFAYGVVRLENCGIGGFGVLLYRGADGQTAALDFAASAPAAARPDSLAGLGIDDLDTGHRVVGVPGLVAGLAAALERFGSITLAQAIAPAERLARGGVVVNSHLANSYLSLPASDAVADIGFPFGLPIPLDPVPGKLMAARLRLFPETARIYLHHGLVPPSPGTRLDLRDYADSLAEIARDGADAFYRGRIGRQIAAEMDRSRTSLYPGDRGLMTYEDLASYRPTWSEPLVSSYRGNTLLGAPPPSSSVIPLEMLNILETFDLDRMKHSSADHLHLVAEAQKLAYADRDAYVADPSFRDVPTAALISDEFAAARRARIDRMKARDHAPGEITGHDAAAARQRRSGHTTSISVIDERGNAVTILCTLGPQFGSAVVAPGTGFLLGAALHLFGPAGSPDEIQPGKRPVGGASPLIAVRNGIPVLVAGGAGGDVIPIGVAHLALNVLSFGLDVGEAIDVARSDEAICCSLTLEEARIPASTIRTLERWGHEIAPLGEYGLGTLLQIAGVDPDSRHRLAASDPKGEYGSARI